MLDIHLAERFQVGPHIRRVDAICAIELDALSLTIESSAPGGTL